VTNQAGNFYVLPSEWTPQYPVCVTIDRVPMLTLISRDGSCAGCHFDPAGPDSPGHVYLALDDGGAPYPEGGCP
jgi:hypothetical protein